MQLFMLYFMCCLQVIEEGFLDMLDYSDFQDIDILFEIFLLEKLYLIVSYMLCGKLILNYFNVFICFI